MLAELLLRLQLRAQPKGFMWGYAELSNSGTQSHKKEMRYYIVLAYSKTDALKCIYTDKKAILHATTLRFI